MKIKSSVMTDDLSDQYISLNQKTQILHDSHTQADSKHIEYFLLSCLCYDENNHKSNNLFGYKQWSSPALLWKHRLSDFPWNPETPVEMMEHDALPQQYALPGSH